MKEDIAIKVKTEYYIWQETLYKINYFKYIKESWRGSVSNVSLYVPSGWIITHHKPDTILNLSNTKECYKISEEEAMIWMIK
jgi:hypothetical protein